MNLKKIILILIEIFSAGLIFVYGGLLPELLPFTIPTWIYYGWFLFIFLFFLLWGDLNKRFSFIDIVFLFWCSVNIILSDIPSVVSPWSRLLIFSLMFMVIGGGIYSGDIVKFRKDLLNIFLWLFVVGTVVSFVLYSAGVRLSVDLLEQNHGIFKQSMVLGPVAALSTIFMLKKTMQSRGKIRMLLGGGIIICLLTCILSASRSAFAGCILGCSIFIFLYNRKFAVLTAVILSMLTLFLFNININTERLGENQYFEKIVEKQEINEQGGGSFYSREALWDALAYDFKNNPVVGSGFFNISSVDFSRMTEENIYIEPGSSWFFVLSSLGSVGLVIMICIFGNVLIKLLKNKKKNADDYFLVSLLLFFIFHMFFEGYIFASGSLLGCTIWLVLGVANDRSLNEIYKNEKDKIATAAKDDFDEESGRCFYEQKQNGTM